MIIAALAIQWNLDLLFPQQSFSHMYRSPFLVPNEVPYKKRYLFLHPSFPELSFYRIQRL